MMTPEHWDDFKTILYIAAVIPVLLVVRFILYMIMPRFVLKRFFSTRKGFKRSDPFKKKKRKWEEDD